MYRLGLDKGKDYYACKVNRHIIRILVGLDKCVGEHQYQIPAQRRSDKRTAIKTFLSCDYAGSLCGCNVADSAFYNVPMIGMY